MSAERGVRIRTVVATSFACPTELVVLRVPCTTAFPVTSKRVSRSQAFSRGDLRAAALSQAIARCPINYPTLYCGAAAGHDIWRKPFDTHTNGVRENSQCHVVTCAEHRQIGARCC